MRVGASTAVAVSLDNDSQIESSTYAEHLNHINVMGDLKNAVIALVALSCLDDDAARHSCRPRASST